MAQIERTYLLPNVTVSADGQCGHDRDAAIARG
jgi:hypothetical protein